MLLKMQLFKRLKCNVPRLLVSKDWLQTFVHVNVYGELFMLLKLNCHVGL